MSLWPDLDNTRPTPNNAVGHAHPRRLTEQALLSSLRHWLLQEYVVAYCHSLATTRIFRRCYWIDALGALPRPTRATMPPAPTDTPRAKHHKRTQEHPALQPVLAVAQQLAQSPLPITLYGYLLSNGRHNKRRSTPPSDTLPKESSIIASTWAESAAWLLSDLTQSPAIFLLNPFGQTLLNYETLLPLYQRTVPTELLFLLPHRQLLYHLQQAQHHPEQATTLTALLRTDRWKSLPTGEEESQQLQQVITRLTELLVTSMQRHFLFPVQSLALPIVSRPATLAESPYTLLFATRRQDSLLIMNDVLCRYRRALTHQSYRGVLNEDWFAQQDAERQQEQRAAITQRIVQLGQTLHRCRWPDLRQQALLASFGTLTIDEYNSIILALLAQGMVRCEWRQRPGGNQQDERVPGTDDMLHW